MIAFMGISLQSSAQSANMVTKNIMVNGNCGMCKTTIEKAGNATSGATVTWDKKTKMANIVYDSNKTNEDEVLKNIALAGYDNEKFLAPDGTYEKLPGCCRYDRAKDTDATPVVGTANATHAEHMDHADHKEMTETKGHSEHMEMAQTDKPLTAVFKKYFLLKDALVKSDATMAATQAEALKMEMNNIKSDALSGETQKLWKKENAGLLKTAEGIHNEKDLAKQRNQFMELSNKMYSLLKEAKYQEPVYYQFCPMANNGKGAYWLSEQKEIKNPYYGSKMMSCGSVKETIQ